MTKLYSGCGYEVEVLDGTPLPGPCPRCGIDYWTTVRPNMGMSGRAPVCPTCHQFWPEPRLEEEMPRKHYPTPAVVEVRLREKVVDVVARSDEEVRNFLALAALLGAKAEVLPYE